ncbi:MAG TPA: type II toxin-antitoxin system RelE/ParE family toxin [Longimicrobium sp.]|nr:type II toxin-antitoxin system RelE/ParE family toxin [Longimicrobium sp.]
MNVRFTSEAESDLLDAGDFYEDVSSEVRDRFDAEVDRVLDLLRTRPHMGTPGLRGTRRVLLHRFPYSLIYCVDRDVSIVAVAHQSRDDTYWHDRLPEP